MLFNIAPTETQTNKLQIGQSGCGPMTKAPFKLAKHDYGNEEVIVAVKAIYATA